MMLDELCAEIRNYFTYDEDRHVGDFSIVNGAIVPSLDITTDYIRIVGSRKNDGVYKVAEMQLTDESEFHGGIWLMSPPQSFLDLAKEIDDWQQKNGGVDSQAMSPFNSESFGGYSYSKSAGTGASGKGASNSWQTAYASRLNIYRRIRTI